MRHVISAAACAAACFSTASTVNAQPAEDPSAVIIIEDGVCFGYFPIAKTGDGDFFIEFSFTGDLNAVVTKQGASITRCTFQVPEELIPDMALAATRGFCFGANGISFDGYTSVTRPNGTVIATCHKDARQGPKSVDF